MKLEIDNAAVIELAAQKIAAEILGDDNGLSTLVRDEVKRRIDKIFADRAETEIARAIDEATANALDQSYCRINAWGEREGADTTIRKELEKLASNYWNVNVDPKSGKPSESSYNKLTRAEFVMAQICGEKFSEQMKQAAISVTAALKDGFRAEMAKNVDALLDSLFRVKSIQDQGKAEKPW